MTTYAPEQTEQQQTDDPFRYGWRYVRRELPEGGAVYDQVPLTLEDVLHPQEGDQVTHSKRHQRIGKYVVNVCEARTKHDPTAVVLDDVRVAWDAPHLKPHGPDIAVIFGVREAQRDWSTFDVAQEGVRPTLIFEITSPETRNIDRVDKPDDYEDAGVEYYIIIDIVRSKRRSQPHLLGYHLTPTGYALMIPNEEGWLWLAPLNVWMGVKDDLVACYDERGEMIGDYLSIDAALATSEAARQEAEIARQVAEARALEAEVVRQQAVEALVEAEQRATEAEAVRQQAEQRIRELEELLRRASEAA